MAAVLTQNCCLIRNKVDLLLVCFRAHFYTHLQSSCQAHVSRSTLRQFFDHRLRRTVSLGSQPVRTNAGSSNGDELCIFRPDTRRVRIVTMNDLELEMKPEMQSTSSVQRETVYTRHQVTADEPRVQQLLSGIREGSRSALAQSITLIESVHPQRRAEGQVLLREVLEYTRQNRRHSLHRVNSFRIGLSGPPGAGKSTHIEALGKLLTSHGHKVAVLAVDPSSSTSGGSLLGDKTRMPELSCDPNAYIRPSPSAGNLGGVTRVTNDAIVLCEGAGYDIILVETVGVGQSEFAVADMVDMFELVLPPAGGDELQGIKKGIVEVADLVVINKSDGDLVQAAQRIQSEYTSALKFVRPKTKQWRPQVMRVSSMTGEGLPQLWEKMKEYRNKLSKSGDLERRREKQHVKWMYNHINDNMRVLFNEHAGVRKLVPKLEFLVEKGALTSGYAADILLQTFASSLREPDNVAAQSVADQLSEAEKQLVESEND